jgi:hypothetical protein
MENSVESLESILLGLVSITMLSGLYTIAAAAF